MLEILREVEVFVFGFGGEGEAGVAAGAEVCILWGVKRIAGES